MQLHHYRETINGTIADKCKLCHNVYKKEVHKGWFIYEYITSMDVKYMNQVNIMCYIISTHVHTYINVSSCNFMYRVSAVLTNSVDLSFNLNPIVCMHVSVTQLLCQNL